MIRSSCLQSTHSCTDNTTVDYFDNNENIKTQLISCKLWSNKERVFFYNF